MVNATGQDGTVPSQSSPPPRSDQSPEVALPSSRVDQLVDQMAFKFRDQNGDGALTREEFDQGRNPLEAKLDPQKFDRYDLDQDGKVDPQEFQAGREKERFNPALRSQLEVPRWDGAPPAST